MNISPKEYSSLLSVVSTLISLDKSRGIEITFDKISDYIRGACAYAQIPTRRRVFPFGQKRSFKGKIFL